MPGVITGDGRTHSVADGMLTLDGGGELDPLVKKRIERCEAALRPEEPKIHECLAFFDNEQYAEVSAITGRLERLETREGGSKPRHRVRLTRNRITPAVMREVSAITSRTPDFEAIPRSNRLVATQGARFGERVLAALYDDLSVKQIAGDTVQYALTTKAGFTWPFWNSDVGEFVVDTDGSVLRTGNIGVHVLHRGEVMWAPGTEFYESPYWIVRKAQPVEEITNKSWYVGPKDLKADAMSAPHENRHGEELRDLVFVYHYLERPSKRYMNGRWLISAQGKQIAKPQDYPCPYDEPVLQWLPYIRRRHRQSPLSMVELMVDIQRTYNRTVSQIVTYKNLVLVPQVFAPTNSMRQQLDDTPGAVWFFRPVAGMTPQWRDMPDLPVGLFRVLDQCIADWQEITGQHQLPAGIESGTGIAAMDARDDRRRDYFIDQFVDWYSRFGLALLRLAAEHFTDDRMLTLQGTFGPEQFQTAKAAVLNHVAQVRVRPESVTPRSRAQAQTIITNLIDRGLVDPKKAISALRDGTWDALIDAYELDRAKQMREIQQLKDAGQGIAEQLPEPDPIADDHAVHLEVLTMWMKTPDFEAQPELVKEAARLHAQIHDRERMGQALQEGMLQTMSAQALGAANAATPQAPGTKPMPSQPSMKTSAEGAQAAASAPDGGSA
jgi:hypothetical protein